MALARTNDPITSQESAKHVVTKLSNVQQRVLNLIQLYPNKTARELEQIAEGTIIPADNVHKRISELAARSSIYSPGKRRCSITKRTAQVWKAPRRKQ